MKKKSIKMLFVWQPSAGGKLAVLFDDGVTAAAVTGEDEVLLSCWYGGGWVSALL